MKLLIGGGGTGGHIYPAIAIARELLRRGDEHEVLFVGAERGLETSIVPKEGFIIKTLNVTGLKGRGIFSKALSLSRLVWAVNSAARFLREYRPDVTLGVGGFASGPVGLATLLYRSPLTLAEQNFAPGMTNKWLGRFAKKVFVTWPGSERLFPKNVGELTGNPVRRGFFETRRKTDSERLNILVLGGSQGARTLNLAVAESVDKLNTVSASITLTAQTGERDFDMVNGALQRAGFPAVAQKFFDDMPQRIADADIVISRAGAGSIAEICAVGRGSVYVPYPYAADDHQRLNAKCAVDAGASIMVADSDFDADRLARIVDEFSKDRSKLVEMGKRAKSLAKPEAAKTIVDEILKLAGGRIAA
ncbi:UDP-N-acetylglucosamine--N-acetylmuramyl-(pentapeptide) pyrophosphoryl-undecaprenol N-acetylglucosamine transferase [hydrothermal vent metagenome]|uniref:UDP-N-acetylglucosamine--N-acetylmuramyl-(Pentapeptide) pyrophosphoryl-undecaprenol N-acetylglucosamine transferase n=1 Tax=hydrothermal vent metagenome TaxID=652676 RepID=A0A3B1BFX5_9ZZZZ